MESARSPHRPENRPNKPVHHPLSTPRFTIGVRFVSLVVLVALLAGGAVGWATINTSRDSLRQQVLHNNLAQADLAAQLTSNYLQAIQAHIQVFASRPDVRQAIFKNVPGEAQSALIQFTQIQTPINGAGIYDVKGIQLVYSSADAATIGQSFADRDWFQGALSTKQPYLGLPILARANNIPVETYAVPILDDQGQLRAILGGGISLAEVSEAIANVDYGLNTRASLVDLRNGGLIIADKDPALILTPVSGNYEAEKRLLNGQDGTIETTGSGGEPELIGFSLCARFTLGHSGSHFRQISFCGSRFLNQKCGYSYRIYYSSGSRHRRLAGAGDYQENQKISSRDQRDRPRQPGL